MVNVSTGIDSLTNFKRDTNRYVTRLKKSGEPVVLTVNGKASVVVQDAASYQELLEQAHSVTTFKMLKKSLADMKAGRVKPLKAALAALEKELGISEMDK